VPILVGDTPGFKPRGGQWVLFRLSDPGKVVALAEMGAHTARDGSLVGIAQPAQFTPSTTVTRANGTVEHEPPQFLPAKIVLVDPDGNNLPYLERLRGGRAQVRDVAIHQDSPSLKDLRPLTHLEDMPPGRVVNTVWAETHHNSNNPPDQHMRLPPEVHLEHGGSMRVADFIARHRRVAEDRGE
jgi:hypothetical protein